MRKEAHSTKFIADQIFSYFRFLNNSCALSLPTLLLIAVMRSFKLDSFSSVMFESSAIEPGDSSLLCTGFSFHPLQSCSSQFDGVYVVSVAWEHIGR